MLVPLALSEDKILYLAGAVFRPSITTPLLKTLKSSGVGLPFILATYVFSFHA